MEVKIGKQIGFTLLELMIIVAVVAILAAIAIPNYSEYVKRGNRVDVQTHIMNVAQNLETYRLVNHSFFGANLTQLGGATYPLNNPYYQLTLTDMSGVAFTNAQANLQSWLLVARPIATGRQKGTGAISLNSAGVKCWYKNNDNANVTATIDNKGNPVPATTCSNQWEDR
ncbi:MULTISPECIES: type IV pilin protein [Acinetobacter]|uniref:type IV pilin protein n=1 Tax=Acinetobacter TaxID=469 RepID=UPI001C553464|nr:MULTISPECIES: type IV pilin protein [Acinetobacter]